MSKIILIVLEQNHNNIAVPLVSATNYTAVIIISTIRNINIVFTYLVNIHTVSCCIAMWRPANVGFGQCSNWILWVLVVCFLVPKETKCNLKPERADWITGCTYPSLFSLKKQTHAECTHYSSNTSQCRIRSLYGLLYPCSLPIKL